MLWLAVVVPDLPLSPFASFRSPFAVTDARKVVACDEGARSRGLYVGMPMVEAGVLCPDLHTCHRDEEAERGVLEVLAATLYRASPQISIRPGGVLARFTDQVTPFRDARQMMTVIGAELEEARIEGQAACAPTAEAALLYATVRPGQILTRRDRWQDALAGLPVACLPFSAPKELLIELGIGTLGECMALPRSGIVRRFGADMAAFLDRLWGVRAETFVPWRPVATFSRKLQMPYPLDSEEALLFVMKRPLAQLTQVLRKRDSVVDRLTLDLGGEGQVRTEEFCLSIPAHRGEVFITLIRERFRDRGLPFAVEDAQVRCDLAVSREGTLALWPEGGVRGEAWGALVDRLQARLGAASVCGLRWHADHRPEKMTSEVPWSAPMPPASCPAGMEAWHPLWLIHPPEGLAAVEGVPQWHGALALAEGPERVETGWWDEAVTREYFVARSIQGQRLWVYRTREGRWFLQGVFA